MNIKIRPIKKSKKLLKKKQTLNIKLFDAITLNKRFKKKLRKLQKNLMKKKKQKKKKTINLNLNLNLKLSLNLHLNQIHHLMIQSLKPKKLLMSQNLKNLVKHMMMKNLRYHVILPRQKKLKKKLRKKL
jgi:hypothetical protein